MRLPTYHPRTKGSIDLVCDVPRLVITILVI
jgi:hypothetical protein